MPIERGQDWGVPGTAHADTPICDDDAAAAKVGGLQTQELVRLKSGDLARTLGVATPERHQEAGWLLPVDVLQVLLDGSRARFAAAHVQIGAWYRSRPVRVAMNAAWVGQRNVAPRAHPGDGLVDVITFDLAPRELFRARRRMATARHLPHPDIAVERRKAWSCELDGRKRVWVDGVDQGPVRRVEIEVLSAALTVAV